MVVDVDVDSIGIGIDIGLGNGDCKMVDEDEDVMDREFPHNKHVSSPLPLFYCHPCFHFVSFLISTFHAPSTFTTSSRMSKNSLLSYVSHIISCAGYAYLQG
jgi:hypothetical protein